MFKGKHYFCEIWYPPSCLESGLTALTCLLYTSPDGGTWEFGYDRSGNLVSRTNPEGAVTRMTCRDGAVASVKDPYGVVTKLAYDRFRSLTEASDSRGNTSLYGYDLLGR